MKQAQLIEELEKLVDAEGLYSVTAALELLCHEKAEHVSINWQDKETASRWTKAAKVFYSAHSQLEKIQGIGG